MKEAQIKDVIIEALQEMIEVYDLPPITIDGDLKLIETLGFTSVDIMHLLASIDMRLQRNIPYEKMIVKGDQYVSDISVQDMTIFIAENYHTTITEPKSMVN